MLKTIKTIDLWEKKDLSTNNFVEFKLEIFKLIRSQTKSAFISLSIVGMVFAYICANYIDHILVGLWYSVFIATAAYRISLFSATVNKENIDASLKKISLLALFNSFLHLIIFMVFPLMSFREQAIITVLMIGLCSGTVSSTGGHFPNYANYTFPIYISLIICWAFFADNDIFSYALAILSFCFAILLTKSSRSFFHTFKQSFIIRLEKNELNAQLEDALNEAIESSKSKARFLAAAGHDLSQPMQSLNLIVDNLELHPLDEKAHALISKLKLSLHTLNEQLMEVLELSRIDAGIIKANLTTLSMDSIRDQLLAEFLPLAQQKKLDLIIAFPSKVFVLSDKNMLLRIFRNLINNAIKYTDKGDVSVVAQLQKDHCRVFISDTGEGIPDDKFEEIFEEFRQLSNPERDRTKGLGLGLSIVQRFSDILKINIQLESKLNQGSKFYFDLPLSKYKDFNSLPDRVEETLEGIKILIVEDENTIAEGLKELLNKLGCKVQLSNNGFEAMQLLKQNRPDLLLSDYRLGGEMNGVQIIKNARKLHPELPTIIISGETDSKNVMQIEKEKISFLSKPVTKKDLVSSIYSLINHS